MDKNNEEILKAWKEQVFDRGDEVDPEESFIWDGVAMGFFLGCGATIEQAANLCRLADEQGLI